MDGCTRTTCAFRTTLLQAAVVIGSLGLLWPCPAAGQKLLRWKLQPGEQLAVHFDQSMAIVTNLMGHEFSSKAQMQMQMQWHVDQVDAGGVAQLSQSIERLKMSLETPGSERVEYDSAAGGQLEGVSAELAGSIQPLIGLQFSQEMSARGEILDVRLSPQAQAQLAKAPAGAQLQQMFSREGLKTLLNQAATVLPAEPIQPGAQWAGTTATQSPVGTLIMEMNYTYRGTEIRHGRPLERIDVSVHVRFGEEANALGLNVAVREQDNSGSLYFDAQAGRFTDTELQQKMLLETAIGDKTHQQHLETVLRMQFEPMPAAGLTGAARPPVRAVSVPRP